MFWILEAQTKLRILLFARFLAVVILNSLLVQLEVPQVLAKIVHYLWNFDPILMCSRCLPVYLFQRLRDCLGIPNEHCPLFSCGLSVPFRLYLFVTESGIWARHLVGLYRPRGPRYYLSNPDPGGDGSFPFH